MLRPKQCVLAVLSLLPSSVNADLFLTENAQAADVWVLITENGNVADCWVHRSELTATPTAGDIWAIATTNAQAADKWIIITDNVSVSDPLSCLLSE